MTPKNEIEKDEEDESHGYLDITNNETRVIAYGRRVAFGDVQTNYELMKFHQHQHAP